MSEDIATYLQSRGVTQVKRASAFEVNVPCFWCNEPDGKRGRLYINTDPNAEIPGLFQCKICDAHGSLVSIKKFFGDISESDEKEDDGFIRRALLEAATDFYHEALTENEKVWSWLKNKRGLTIETVRKFRLGYANGGLYHYLKEREFKTSDILATGLVRDHNGIKDLFDQHLTIPYQVAGNVMMIRGRDLRAGAERKYVTPSGQKARLYNSDAVWTADQVVACEGEFDCIVLSQLGYAAVAVPGANSWQPTWNDYFSDTRRLYVVFDGDDAGRKGADKVQEILGIKARRVEMPPGTDISDWIVTEGHTKEDFDKLLKGSAGGLLVTVDEAYEEYCKVQGQTGLKFGYSELDFHLEPGLLPGQILISLARTGVGKTISLLNLLEGIARAQPDANMLFISLEQTRGDWFERARRIRRFHNLGTSDQDALDFWRQRLMLVDKNRVSIDQIYQVVDDYIYEMGSKPDVVALDYLGYFARSFKGEAYQRTTDAVMTLKEFAKESRISVVVPHQMNRSVMRGATPSLEAARDSGAVEETADIVLGLSSPDNSDGRKWEERTGELDMVISKSRHGSQNKSLRNIFAPLSLAIVPENEHPLAEWARNEIYYQVQYREDWEMAQARHEAGTRKDEPDYRKVERLLWQKRQGKLNED